MAKTESTKLALADSLTKEPLDFNRIKKSLSEFYSKTLEANLAILEQVAQKEKFSAAQKKELTEALILMAKIQDCKARIQQNSRNHDELAQADTIACQRILDKLCPKCDSRLNRNGAQYMSVRNAIQNQQKQSQATKQTKKTTKTAARR